jgi:hypothetical protein
LRLRWTEQAGADLIDLAERAPMAAAAVLEAMEWMARVGFSVGRPVGDEGRERYWPVPPHGVYYRLEGDALS